VTADPLSWDWSRPIYDHVQLHVQDLEASVHFYETALAPLGIPVFYVRDDQAELPNLALVAGRPPSGPLHLAFRASPTTTRRTCSTPTTTTSKPSIERSEPLRG
jgi:catechol 2,3-dioxygenase-like lactoylglutathione lyase family enzyme